MKLADVIDLEIQLEADRAMSGDLLRTRDRAIGRGLASRAAGERGSAEELCAWLSALRAQTPERRWLGEQVTRGARWIAASLVVLGLSLGAGTARVLVHFDGVRPVNVLPILGILVLLQLLLLLLVVCSVLLSVLAPGLAASVPFVGDVRALLAGIAGRLAARQLRQAGGRGRLLATLHRLRARSALYGKLELWWMTLIAQCFGIAFNAGAIAVLATLPVVLKYSFCWSTTLRIGASALHQFTSLLSWPWHAIAPLAVPSLRLIETTQFDILVREYAGGRQVASGQWWPFIVACVVTYGLLPRLILAMLAASGLRRALIQLPLDTPDVEAVLRRLRLPLVETRGPQPQPKTHTPATGTARRVVAAPAATACAVVSWRDLPVDRTALDAWLSEELGWSVRELLAAGGAEFERDEQAIATAAASALPVVVLAEAWEPPDKAVRRFLQSLRSAAGRGTKLLVGLVATRDGRWTLADPRDVETWSTQLAALEDPYLSVESMGR